MFQNLFGIVALNCVLTSKVKESESERESTNIHCNNAFEISTDFENCLMFSFQEILQIRLFILFLLFVFMCILLVLKIPFSNESS